MKVELKNIYLGKVGINDGKSLNLIDQYHYFYYDQAKSFNHALDLETGQLLFVPNVEDLVDGAIVANNNYVVLTKKLIIESGQEEIIRKKCQKYLPKYFEYIEYLNQPKYKSKIR